MTPSLLPPGPHARRILRVTLALAACLCARIAPAQNGAPLPDPDLDLRTNGIVRAVARQSNGGLIVGGEFTAVDGVPRNHLARLNPDGTLDPQWNPAPDDVVTALAVAGNQSVLVGGQFWRIGGKVKPVLAKLAGGGAGAAVDAWTPPQVGAIDGLAVAPGGAVYALGYFGGADPVPSGIVKLDGASGVRLARWNVTLDSGASVAHAVVDAAGDVYVSGRFSAVGGTARAGLAKLRGADGALVAGWQPAAATPYPSLLAVDDAGFLYAETGANRKLRKLDGMDGSAVAGWSAPVPAGSWIQALDPADGKLFVAFRTDGSDPRLQTRVYRLDAATGARDTGFQLVLPPAARVHALAAEAGGRVSLGGEFGALAGRLRLGVARVDADGALLESAHVERAGEVRAIRRTGDGGFLVGGDFWMAGDLPRWNLLRLDARGRLAADWNVPLNGPVTAIAAGTGAGARAYVAGDFTLAKGQSRAFLAAVDPAAGTVPEDWNPAPDHPPAALAVDASGGVLVGGTFHEIAAQPRPNLARLDGASGALLDGWSPQPDGGIDAIGIAPDGMVYVTGAFQRIGGGARSRIAKLRGDTGTLVAAWNPAPDSSVDEFVLHGADAMFVRGFFTRIGGRTLDRMAKLSLSTGQADAAWSPPDAAYDIQALGVSPEGILHAAGLAGRVQQLSTQTGAIVRALSQPMGYPLAIRSLAYAADGTLYLGGGHLAFPSTTRAGVAAFSKYPDRIFADGLD